MRVDVNYRPLGALAVLEGIPLLGDGTPAGAPPGLTDWHEQVQSVTTQILTESDNAKKTVLNSALGIATAALPIPVVGWIVAGSTAALALFGISIRGATQHVPESQTDQKATEFATTKIRTMYNALPQDAKDQMFGFMDQWQDRMYRTFRTWWGRTNVQPPYPEGKVLHDRLASLLAHGQQWGIAAQDRTAQGGGTADNLRGSDWDHIYPNNRGQMVQDNAGYYFTTIMHQADADSVNENMKVWYFDPLDVMVLRPLDAYMLSKYNETVAQYENLGGTGVNTVSSAGMGTALGLALVALPFLPKLLKGK